MIRKQYTFELLTPCFCGGAEPRERAEIRAASIRGQLRWWFRTLGGFKTLAASSIPKQEATIFGSTRGEGRASLLTLRVSPPASGCTVKDADELGMQLNTNKGYLVFNLRSKRGAYAGRALLEPSTQFRLETVWRGSAELESDLDALVRLFAHIGALGSRSRRAMGALVLSRESLLVSQLAQHFARSDSIEIRELPGTYGDPDAAADRLASWFKQWRSHGRSADHRTARPPNPPHNAGFKYAKNDHDRGVEVLRLRGRETGVTFRPSLGLPIVQFFSGERATVNWSPDRDERGRPVGRFASPVILRPHRGVDGRIHALVIFVDVHRWPEDKPVYLNGEERAVSLDLYEAMKADPVLKPFQG